VPIGADLLVKWDFGDNFSTTTPSNVSPPHQCPAADTYTVIATVTVTGSNSPGIGSVTTTILP
jgi:hypothetical protein